MSFCKQCGKEYIPNKSFGNWRKGNIQRLGHGGVDVENFCCFECGMKHRWINKEKTFILRYGVKNNFAIETIKEKVEISIKSEECKNKRKNTCKEKYGVENPSQSKIIKRKKEETCLKHYGVKCGLCLDISREKRKSKESLLKEYATKAKNNSWNNSKTEIELLKLLKNKFCDVKTQYSSELYPFRCDFYIPDLDLYIEFQGTFEHGKKGNKHLGPYDKNNIEHEKLLSFWKKKLEEGYKRYKSAINVWTIRDPLKRQTAKENNLNWLEFFTIKEFMDWYERI